MANTKISNLTSAGTLSGTEVAPIVQSSNTVKVTTQNIANLALPSQTGNANKYLQTNGTVASWDAIDISTADVTGTLPIANGGTGQTSASSAINALLPSQTGNANKYLQTNGTVASWAAVSAGKQTAIFRVTTNGSGAVSATEIQGISGATWAATISGSNIVLTPTPNIFTFNSIAYGSTGITSGSAILFCIPQSLGGSSQTFSFYDTSNAQVNMSTTATASGQYIVLTIIIN
jgi:hypothetical protein